MTDVTTDPSTTAPDERDSLFGTFDAISLKRRTFAEGVSTGDVTISGDPSKLRELFGLLDEFPPDFEIVEPRKVSVE